jgi:hypothetical protein
LEPPPPLPAARFAPPPAPDFLPADFFAPPLPEEPFEPPDLFAPPFFDDSSSPLFEDFFDDFLEAIPLPPLSTDGWKSLRDNVTNDGAAVINFSSSRPHEIRARAPRRKSDARRRRRPLSTRRPAA